MIWGVRRLSDVLPDVMRWWTAIDSVRVGTVVGAFRSALSALPGRVDGLTVARKGRVRAQPRDVREALAAESEDALLARVMTGKQGRMLRTEDVDSRRAPGAPAPLTWPMPSILNGCLYKRAERAGHLGYWT